MANAKLTDVNREQLAMYFEYLDELRESGATNMFGARPYLVENFDIGSEKAGRILSAWMNADLTVAPELRAEQVLAS